MRGDPRRFAVARALDRRSAMRTSMPAVLFVVGLLGSSVAWAGPAEDDFANRCADPDVVKCVSFDEAAEVDPFVYPPSGEEQKRGIVDADVRASGDGSLRFEIPSNTGADTSGSFWQNFSDDLSVQFGEGEEFYVQWRQRFSPEFLATAYEGGGGWKQVIIGEGDRADGSIAYSCTTLEVVTVNGYHRGFPSMYHSCGVKDGQYEGLEEPVPPYDFLLQNAVRDPGCLYSLGNAGNGYVPPCIGYVADEWMTFQVHVAIGTWYQNDGVYHHDSTVQLWVGAEGETSQLAIDFSPTDPECQGTQESLPGCQTGYDLVNDNPDAKYGKVWLLPYNTGKDPAASHPTAYTWFDELVISRSPIPDPGAAPPPGSDESGSEGGADDSGGDVDDDGGVDDGVGESAASADDASDAADTNDVTTDEGDGGAAPDDDAQGCGCRADNDRVPWFLAFVVAALFRRAECKRSTKP
jgi:hypothetical protein